MKTKENDITMFADLPDVLSVQQVRAVLNIGRPSVYQLVKQKKIRCFMIGNAYKIPKASLIAYIQESCRGGDEE